ncbi:sensor domain-containing diguanylate cyclase [Planctomycetota bacterium]|nr:sensor domain-containing diguanylate cyclase [Planctomycetota bacterium]
MTQAIAHSNHSDSISATLDLYTQLISTTTDFISFVDCDERYQIVNDRYVVATGLSKNEIIGSHIKDVIGSEIYESKTKAALKKCYAGSPVEYEGWFSYPAQGRRYVRTRLIPNRNIQNQIIGILIHSHDLTEQKLAEDKTIESEAMFRQMFEGHASPMLLLDIQTGLIHDANPQACTFFQLSHNEIINISANKIATLEESEQGVFDRLLGGFTDCDEQSITLNSGEQKEVEIQSIPIWVEHEAHLCIVIRDITQETTNQRELATLFKNTQVGIGIMKPGRTIHKCNQKLCDIFGYSCNKELETQSTQILHFDTPEEMKFVQSYRDQLKQGEHVHTDLKLKRKDGSAVWCTLTANPLDTNVPPNLDKGILWVVDDISQRKAIEGMLQKIASKDGLTGIYNRTFFLETTKKTIHNATSQNQHCSMIMLDVDHFKKVNDNYGHPAGDLVLKTITQRINKMLRKNDDFGRMGGEEFGILLPNSSIKNTFNIAERIRQSIESEPICIGCKKLDITISLGIASINDSIRDMKQLSSAADKALYEAKNAGRNQVCSFHNFCNI